MALVYRHRRLDNLSIFYIGVSSNYKRPYDNNKRTNLWKNTANKSGYIVEIIQEDLIWEDACELEIFLIELYGRKDKGFGKLVNLTDGGDGTLGHTHTDEWKNKVSELNSKRIWSDESRLKLSINSKNCKNNYFNNQNGGKNNSAVKVIDIETGKIYDTIKEASIEYNIKYTTLKEWIGRGYKNNKTNLRRYDENVVYTK